MFLGTGEGAFTALSFYNISDCLGGQNIGNKVFATRQFRKNGAQLVECPKHAADTPTVLGVGGKFTAIFMGTLPKRSHKALKCPVLGTSSVRSVGVSICEPCAGEHYGLNGARSHWQI